MAPRKSISKGRKEGTTGDEPAVAGSPGIAPHATASRSPIDEEANRRALDEAAGVPATNMGTLPVRREVARPANAAPLLKADTREKRLYVVACSGTPLGQEFFDEFPDVKEMLELALSISARLMVVAACNTELAPTQRISAIRVLAALAGKQVPDAEESPLARPGAPLVMPTGASQDVESTLDKIRKLSAG